jgi:hypothetical protein
MASASYNAGSEAINANQHQSVEGPENSSLRGIAPQYIDLLSENQDFRLQPPSRVKYAGQCRPQQYENVDPRDEHQPIRPVSQTYRVPTRQVATTAFSRVTEALPYGHRPPHRPDL